MSFSDFTIGRLIDQFSLTIEDKSNLYGEICPVVVRPEFAADLAETIPLGLEVATEKARSEFIIAPVLTEFWRLTKHSVGLHSGVEFIVDQENGLAGVCDYIITRSPHQLFLSRPIILLVEAKNEDMKRGYAQCVAEMMAAQRFNDRDRSPNDTVYGAVTIGERWRFLEIQGTTVRIDTVDYYIENVGKILGILLNMVAS